MARSIVSLVALVALAACGDPLRDVDRLSDVGTAQPGASMAAPAEEAQQQGGLFARLLNRPAADPTNAAIDAALAEATGTPIEEAPEAPEGAEVAATPTDQTPQRRGLFGLFGARNRSANEGPAATEAPAPETADTESDTPTLPEAEVVPAAATVTEPDSAVEPGGRGLRGLFGRRAPAVEAVPSGPDAQIVAAGTVLPFGEIARVCDLPNNRRGQQVANVSGFRVYDSIPNSTAARPHYITGFDDNCARTFTAAVVVPADVTTHEFMRYQALSSLPYNAVDNAYEAIKATVCRVGRGQPCGARTDRLARNTHFLSVYRNFGGNNASWAEILLRDGQVVAMDLKDS